MDQGKHHVDVISTDDYTIDLLEKYDALVLSPGPGLPDDFENLKKAIRDAEGVLPIWGVCLGHQAIAEAYSGLVYQLPLVMHGIKSDIKILDRKGLWRGIEVPDPVGRYHSWMVSDVDFPEELIVTSRDDAGRIMSFRHRSLPIFGVQFHPESYMSDQGLLLAKNFMEIVDKLH